MPGACYKIDNDGVCPSSNVFWIEKGNGLSVSTRSVFHTFQPVLYNGEIPYVQWGSDVRWGCLNHLL